MPCLLSLNVTNEFTPQSNQMGNDHFTWTEYQLRICVFGWCVVAAKERSTSIIHVASPPWQLRQCCYQWANTEGQGVPGAAATLHSRDALPSLRCCSHSQCRGGMAMAHNSLKSSAAPFSRTWTSSTYSGSRTLISEPGVRCLTTTTVRKNMSCRGSWSCRKRRGCICSGSRRRPCWHSYSSTRKRESTYPARHLAPHCSRLPHLLRLHRYVHMAIITHVRGRPLPPLLIGCGYVVARLPSHSV